jgi:hypothetical protein
MDNSTLRDATIHAPIVSYNKVALKFYRQIKKYDILLVYDFENIDSEKFSK